MNPFNKLKALERYHQQISNFALEKFSWVWKFDGKFRLLNADKAAKF